MSFDDIIAPVLSIINSVLPAVLTVVGAVGMIWCIVLGVKLAKAEEAQDRDKAKSALINAIIGYVLIFVLIAVLTVAEDALYTWLQENYL